ncbi:Krev interaction trapped protein 1 [Geranomyces variabilis]|uniref:Krev interaction trapped protein 1 n=1 Tax=Geranomyces variabilis TaxID=109894 RepID=A0AAD5XTR8_9FUNG|nr:Krev interaction trapped protein 1 [Geranomyces variabilis]
MGIFSKSKGKKDHHHSSNPLLHEQALTRRAPAEAAITKAPEAAREAEWQPPLQRHIKPDDGTEFVTIRVRILNGDSEHDFNAKFPAGPLLGSRISKIIAQKESIPPEAAHLFTLWIVAKDLEIQLRPDADIFTIMAQWNTMVLDFTHYPEAIDPSHPINRHWFVYRREASVTKDAERRYTDDATVRLLYGEAKRNVMTGRYVCTLSDAVALGGIMLAISAGSFDRIRHPAGFIVKNDMWKTLVPKRLHGDLKPDEWETCLQAEHAKHVGKSTEVLRIMYLELVREWACYGCSFFPCCRERPPAGFFEFRLQRWLLGVSTAGIVVMDLDKNGYAFAEQWEHLTVKKTPDRIILRWKDSPEGKENKLKLYTPQAVLVANLGLRSKYIMLKEQAGESDENKRPKTYPNIRPKSSSATGLSSLEQQTRAPVQPPRQRASSTARQGNQGSEMPPVYEETTKHHPAGVNVDPAQLVPPQLRVGQPVSYGNAIYSTGSQPAPAPVDPPQIDARLSYRAPRPAGEPTAPPMEDWRLLESANQQPESVQNSRFTQDQQGPPVLVRQESSGWQSDEVGGSYASTQPHRHPQQEQQQSGSRLSQQPAATVRSPHPLASQPSQPVASATTTDSSSRRLSGAIGTFAKSPSSNTGPLAGFGTSTSFQQQPQQQLTSPSGFVEPRRVSMQNYGWIAQTQQDIDLQKQIAELENLQVGRFDDDDSDEEPMQRPVDSPSAPILPSPSPIATQAYSLTAFSAMPANPSVGYTLGSSNYAGQAIAEGSNFSLEGDAVPDIPGGAGVTTASYVASGRPQQGVGNMHATGNNPNNRRSVRSRSGSISNRTFEQSQPSEILEGYERPSVVSTRRTSVAQSLANAFKKSESFTESTGGIRRGADAGPNWSAGSYADY